MRAFSFSEYAQDVARSIEACMASGQAVSVDQTIDQRSMLRGFIGGVLRFEGGSELHFREFVDVSQPEARLAYAYHYQDAEKNLIFRYDNAAHKPSLSQPEHKHTSSGIEPSGAPTLQMVIDEILD